MQASAVIGFLEKFPTIDWPYGFIVAVQENSLRSGDDTSRIEQNKSELLRYLGDAGVKVDLWP
jgi:hypothetical protein